MHRRYLKTFAYLLLIIITGCSIVLVSKSSKVDVKVNSNVELDSVKALNLDNGKIKKN